MTNSKNIFDLIKEENINTDEEDGGNDKEAFVPAGSGGGQPMPQQGMSPQQGPPPQGTPAPSQPPATPPQGGAMPPGSASPPSPGGGPQMGGASLPPGIEEALMNQMPGQQDTITLKRDELKQILTEAISAVKGEESESEDKGEKTNESKSDTNNLGEKIDQLSEQIATLTELIAGGPVNSGPPQGSPPGGELGGLINPQGGPPTPPPSEGEEGPQAPQLSPPPQSDGETSKLLGTIQDLQGE